MEDNQIVNNVFDPRKTKTVIVHSGRFHADDMMFVALAKVAAEKYKNVIEVKRMAEMPNTYSPDVVVGDVGGGRYDHHDQEMKNSQDHTPAACGILYREIADFLFPGSSDTKRSFEAFIDIIEHCDNTSDNNTFSDAINFMAPLDENLSDDYANKAIAFCRSVVLGFMTYHDREKSGKSWSVPRACRGIVPGCDEKKDQRYFKANHQTKMKYKYLSFNGKRNLTLGSMDTYSIACGALNQQKRQYWREEIEKLDKAKIEEMTRREQEEWPLAVQNAKHRTIELERYVAYGPYVKNLSDLFVVMPSQRGGYTVNFLKTSNGKYRFNPDLLMDFDGCSFVPNDKRFLFFDTREQALNAAHAAGKTVDKFLENNGLEGYRSIFGGVKDGYTGDLYQDLIAEDIALNLYVKDTVSDCDDLTVQEYRKIQVSIMGNPYLIHSFCTRFCNYGESMSWKTEASVLTAQNLTNDTLWTKNQNGARWDTGLKSFLDTKTGVQVANELGKDISQYR